MVYLTAERTAGTLEAGSVETTAAGSAAETVGQMVYLTAAKKVEKSAALMVVQWADL